MKAALLKGPGKLRIEEVEDPERPPQGMLVRTLACSICGTDAKMWWQGHRDLTYPRILGHELVGVVEEVEPGSGFEEGDLVQVWPGVACGRCDPCKRGRDNQCQSVGIIGFNLDGGLAELVALPAGCLRCGGVNLVPDELSVEAAALAEPLACCINGQDACGILPGERVMVIGAGPMGLMHGLLARKREAGMVVLVESDPDRAAGAEIISPDLVLGPGWSWDQVLEATGGEGVDVMILAAPRVEVGDAMLGVLRAGGRLSLFSGMPSTASRRELDLNIIHYQELAVIGAYGCRSQDCRRALELLGQGLIDPGWMFTCRVPLERTEEALLHQQRREGLKSIVMMGRG